MPDLKQALKDFVATSNSGVYKDETTLLSKFPELKSYDINALKDFVATSNSGVYTSEDELFSKFPEFGISKEAEALKKKESITTVSPLEDTFLASQKQLPSFEVSPLRAEAPVKKEKLLKNLEAFEQATDRNAYLDNIGTRALSGVTSFDKMVASIPESIINVASLPQNALAWATGWDIAANADTFKKTLGISNPILDKLNEEEKRLSAKTEKFNQERYESTGIVDNIQKGNYQDAFELLGSNIIESAPVSIAMMVGGATLAPTELAAISTAAFLEQNREQLGEENPDMPEVEKTVKALGMAAAETVFSAIGTGTIGQVYKDIIKKEGVEVGKNIFRDGLVATYKSALTKYGVPIGLLGEGIEEAATQITQNVLSDKPAFQGVADAFVTGAGSGVVFTAPISAIKARDKIKDFVETSQSKNAIKTVLKDNELTQIYNVPKDSPITSEQIEIANTNKSRNILVKNLDKKVKNGEISEDDAKQSIYVFDKIQQVSNSVKDLNVTNSEKAEIATLLSKRNQLTTDIQNKDDVLVVKEKQEIADINKKIQDIILVSKPQQVEEVAAETNLGLEKELREEFNYDYYEENLNSEFEWQRDFAKEFLNDPKAAFEKSIKLFKDALQREPNNQSYKDSLDYNEERLNKWNEINNKYKTEQDAIQKQITDEGLLRSQGPQLGLQKMGEGNQGLEVAATGTQEVAPTQPQQEIVKAKFEGPITQESLETIPEKDISDVTEQINNGQAKLNIDAFPATELGTDNKITNNQNVYLLHSQGKEIGILTVNNEKLGNRDESSIAGVVLHPDVQGKGIGKEMYRYVNNDLIENGKQPLKSDYDITPDAINVWKSLVKSGEATQIGVSEKNNVPLFQMNKPSVELVSLKTQAPKFVRDISALITPATVRGFSPLTERIKKLSLNYDKLVKQYAKKKDPKVLAKIKTAEAQILNDAKQEIIDAVANIDGVSVQFKDTKRGLWDKKFEPSFNMTLSVSPQADTKKVSDLLFDFAEKYSQDAFILETNSDLEDDVINKGREMPLTEFDENNLMNYPQIIYTFAEPITDEQVADLSVALESEGIDAFNINNNELQVSVIKFLSQDEQNNLTNDEQYQERTRDFDSKTIAIAKATSDVLGSDGKGASSIRIKKSSYQGATNEGSADQTRQFNRSDVFKAFKESTTKVETLAVELADLRQKEIDLQKEGKKLSTEDQTRFNELVKKVQPVVQRTFEANKKLYEDAKTEVEGIAQDAISQVDASISPFPIKRAERASVKAIRWYNAFTEKLGDGSRVNIVVDTDANADKVFKIIDEKYPGDTEVRRITETTELGYPKRLIEIRTSNGTLAEIQVITNEAYLAKDGIKGFTGDEKQKATAKQKLDEVRARLGWNIPDGLGHYFYEIQRDTNVDDTLRDEAARLSDLYYDAFTNPKSTLTESFMNDVNTFKNNVDAADKSQWDVGNNGKAPQSLIDYKPVQAEAALMIEEEQFIPMKASEVKNDAFTKDNAIDYIEDEKDTDSGRTVTYISSLTVEARNIDGEPIGTITKLTDEDKIFSFTATDIDGNEINFDGFETLGEVKQALADKNNKIQKKEFDKEQKKRAKEKAKVEAKKAKAKAKAKPTVEEQVTGALDDLLALDPNDKTTLKKISNSLDQVIKDIDKFEKENLGVNIALPVMKTILKAIKALVDAGVVLQDAIKRVAKDNNVNSRDVIDGINAISQIAPIQSQYDALMAKADDLIARQKLRNIADAKIVSNLDTFIRNSDIYKESNDAQKKIMEREARLKMGVGAKRAVSIGRVLGALKDITNISREEKMLVIKQIRDLSRDAAKELAKDIREMASKGKITSIQAANIVSRFGKVNMLNEISVSNFVDYMAKVFANAEYADKIDVAKSKLKMAKKNIVTKIGIADGLVGKLNQLFSMNPTLIPNEYLGRYLELVDMFGARQAVLTLDEKSAVTKDVQAILDEIDNEQSKADELADRFNASENKVFKDDELDYAASIKKMLDGKEIDEKEADTMRKYKEDIAPQVEETELTEDELAAERKELTDAVKKSTIDGSGLSTKYERDTVKELSRLVRTDAVDSLTNTELKNLLKVIDNINNNYLPHYGEIMLEKLDGLNTDKVLTKAVEQSKMYKFSELYSKAKAAVAMQGRTGVLEMVRRNPLFYIDQLFGNFKTKEIFNSLFNEPAKAVAVFKTQLNRVQNILEKAEEKVAKSFGLEPNAVTMSKFKMMTYMVQLEFESNKGNKEVNPASDYLKATIKHIDAGKSRFGERDADMLQQILKDFAPDGNIDNEKLYNSFNQAEKDAIKDIRGINESLREKAEFTAAIIRGDRIDPLNNYVHLNVLHEYQPNDLTSGSAFVTEYNNAMRPSTKAKSLIARTGKVSPLNFDIFASAQRGAKFVLMDFNLTKPIRTSRKTISGTIANLESKGRIPKEQRQIINAINAAFEESIETLLTNTFTQDSALDIAIDYISKQGYRAVLAGTNRFTSELTSNIGFAVISDPKALITGIKYRGVIMSSDAPMIMENLKSKQTNRVFPTDTLSGRLVDTSILSQASGIKGAVSKNPVKNKIQQIWNRSGKKYVNAIELQADALISTPDKLTMRPMWFGSFANQFENITGNEVDFKKIAENDETYMEANKEALDKATQLADERSVMVGATDNPFMGILKGNIKPDQKLALRAFNNFNNFMTKFLIFEYVTARTAIMAAIGNGSLTKKQGGAVLGAVATRMVVYGLILQMMGTGLMGLFFDDDEPETEKSFMQKLGQAFASAFSSLLIGRDFGNAVKNVLNYGIEEANEKYLDFLREGEYDPYKDGIAYTLIPRDDSKQTDLGKLLMNMGGAYTPALNTAAFIVKKVTEKPKVKEDAIARREKEIKIRIPLEVLGNAGLIPLYKDIRKAVMKDMYKDLEKAEKTKGDKKKAEAEKLQGFKNQEDMKRYDYELWYRTFGPDAIDFDAKQAEKLIKKTKDSLERAMKDDMYDYTPKPKNSKEGLQKLY